MEAVKYVFYSFFWKVLTIKALLRPLQQRAQDMKHEVLRWHCCAVESLYKSAGVRKVWSVITLTSHIYLLALKLLLITDHSLWCAWLPFIPFPKFSSLPSLHAKTIILSAAKIHTSDIFICVLRNSFTTLNYFISTLVLVYVATEPLLLTFVFNIFSYVSLSFVFVAHWAILFYLLITFLKELTKPFSDLLMKYFHLSKLYKGPACGLNSTIWTSVLWTSLLSCWCLLLVKFPSIRADTLNLMHIALISPRLLLE